MLVNFSQLSHAGFVVHRLIQRHRTPLKNHHRLGPLPETASSSGALEASGSTTLRSWRWVVHLLRNSILTACRVVNIVFLLSCARLETSPIA